MIKIIANNDNKIILRRYPTKLWFVFFCGTIAVIIVNYQILFNAPIYSSLTCDRGWLNTIDCELVESALFNSNLTHKTIKHIHKPEDILGRGKTLLNTDINTFHKRIKNNYYPSYGFVGLKFRDLHRYRFRQQAIVEVNRIKIQNYIKDRNQSDSLTIIYKVPLFFYPFLLLFPSTILLGIFCVLAQPITTYTFNWQQNELMIIEKSPFTSNNKNHSIDKLEIASVDKQKNSIMLTADTKISYLFDYFQNPQQALQAIDKLKQHIK